MGQLTHTEWQPRHYEDHKVLRSYYEDGRERYQGRCQVRKWQLFFRSRLREERAEANARRWRRKPVPWCGEGGHGWHYKDVVHPFGTPRRWQREVSGHSLYHGDEPFGDG